MLRGRVAERCASSSLLSLVAVVVVVVVVVVASGRCYRSACLVTIVLACVFTFPLRVMADYK